MAIDTTWSSFSRCSTRGLPAADCRKDIACSKDSRFLARGNIVDLAVAVVIGTAFTALVTKFTDSIITPLINRIGVNAQSDVGILRIGIGGGQTIDLNVLLSAAINFS